MNIHELIRLRKSVRTWADRPVPRKTVEAILETARFAPSARNSQDWHVVAVSDPSLRSRLGEIAGGQEFVGRAPVVLAVCGDSSTGTMACGMPRHVVDASILIDHITLVAAVEGLGTCWIGHFDQEDARSLLGLPDGWNVVQLLPLGYPADPGPVIKRRKEVGEMLSVDGWGGRG